MRNAIGNAKIEEGGIKMKLKSSKGFTLIELVITIIIIGILAVLAVPMYRTYVRRAIAVEARNTFSNLATSEKLYFAEHNQYSNIFTDVNFNLAQNKYFTTGSINGNGVGTTATLNATLTPEAGTDAVGMTASMNIAANTGVVTITINDNGTPMP